MREKKQEGGGPTFETEGQGPRKRNTQLNIKKRYLHIHVITLYFVLM